MARRPDTPCSKCGKLLWSGRTSLPAERRVCRECRNATGALSPRPCAHCGVEFKPKKPGRVACSTECGAKVRLRGKRAQQPSPPRHRCPVCGAGFRLSYGGQRTCSRTCAAILRFGPTDKRPRRRRGPREIACAVCAVRFRPSGSNARYCSNQCRIDAAGARVNDLYGLACQRGWSGARWRGLLVGYLRDRDGSRCRICGKAIRFDLPSGPRGDASGLGPSVDHVVPRSQGGGDELANLRLTHWLCNWVRRAGGGNEQLMLFG